MLKFALLGFLNYSAMTGYELKQIMDSSTSNFWHAKQSQIYATLKKCESDGLVYSEVEVQDGRPNRRVYTITAAGKADLEAWLAVPFVELEAQKQKLLLKLFFGAALEKDALLTQLRIQKELHQQQIQYYKTQSKEIIARFSAAKPDMEKEAIMWEATRRFGEMFEEMYTQWLTETIVQVEEEL